jgi:hypothetical protein
MQWKLFKVSNTNENTMIEDLNLKSLKNSEN